MIRVKKDKLIDMLEVGDLLICKMHDKYIDPLIITSRWEGKDDKDFAKSTYWVYNLKDKLFFYNSDLSHSSIETALAFVFEVYRRNSNSYYEIFAYRENNTWYLVNDADVDEQKSWSYSKGC